MTERLEAMEVAPTTDGEIAAINLESARHRSWSRFWQAPEQPGVAEFIVEQEMVSAQFLGDVRALDRLEMLGRQLSPLGVESMRAHLIGAQIAATAHRFADARRHVSQAMIHGAPADATSRLLLSVDQACGMHLDRVLEARVRMAASSRQLEDWVPLGALLADLKEFEEAEQVYFRAMREYTDVSPFALAWVCFQLGVLWGELVPDPQPRRAAQWYRQAIALVPRYVKARVHLAEIELDSSQFVYAESLLLPAVASGDPEVHWRLADVMTAMGRPVEADSHMSAARAGFDALLERHLLAFADHGAEFYCGSGGNAMRAFALASVNAANRPTLRALEQAHSTAAVAGETQAASDFLEAVVGRLEEAAALRRSVPELRADTGAPT